MPALSLTATTNEHKKILAYLQANASDVLIDKINNGVIIEKDGKRLINKKDLKDFMSYANGEARKLAAKGENGVCIDDNTVYGWAAHYFEENSIEGKLFNEDGTEYKPAKAKPTPSTSVPVKTEPPKPKDTQATFFDMLNATDEDNFEIDEKDGEELNADYTPEELEELTGENETADQANDRELIEKAAKPKDMSRSTPVHPIYKRYLDIQKKYQDSVLFLRLGDFYEAFGDIAANIAEPLNLTITSRVFGEERVPMIGVPYHAFDNYLTKLIKTGYKVAVAEEENDITVFPEYEEEIEELTESDMRKFDGDITEPEELPTVSKVTEGVEIEDDGKDIISETNLRLYFDKAALIDLFDILEDKVDLL